MMASIPDDSYYNMVGVLGGVSHNWGGVLGGVNTLRVVKKIREKRRTIRDNNVDLWLSLLNIIIKYIPA
jgi:hypothetical protein